MTQKRGLGRGLGALIPGAGSPVARPSAPSAPAAPASPAEAEGLRTRNHPRTAPEPGEAGASSRPVDMFFSGDPVGGTDRQGGRGGSGRDVAGAMARAAAERRASAKKPAAKSSASSPAKAAASRGASAPKAEEKAPVAETAAAPAEKAPAPTKKPAAKKSAAKKAPGRTTASKTTSSKTKASPGTTNEKAESAPSPVSPGVTEPVLPASDRAEDTEPDATAAASAAIESAVEVERVTPTPARSRRTTAPAEKDTAAAEDTAAKDGAAKDGADSTDSSSAPAVDAAVPAPGADGAAPADTDAADADDARSADTADADAADPEAPDADAPAAASGHEDLLPVPGAEFAEIPIHEIRENPRNPRTQFDEDALDELAYSLREVGVLQPIVVRPIPATDSGESFELVMGERRWRAARRAGLAAIPAIIRETTDDDLLRDALLENLHRAQLNPLEEAAAYQQLLEDFGCTQDELADRIGRSRPQISNTLRLMKLPPLVQRRLASGALSAGHARALLTLDSPALMEELAQRVVAEGLSVRAVERLVSRGVEPAAATKTPRRTSYDPRVVDYTSRLATRLEAPVRIDVGKRKGKITLEFTNLEDLERLMGRLGLDEHVAAASEGAEGTVEQD